MRHLARPFQLAGPRSTDSPPGSSPEVSCPSSASSKERLPTAGLPPPLRSAYAVSHDLDGLLRSMPLPGIAPGNTHGVPTLQGHSRLARKAPFPKLPAPHGFSKATPPRAGTQRAHATLLNLQGITPPADRIRPLPVSLRRGTDTLLGFLLWDLASTDLPRGKPHGLFGSRSAPSRVLIEKEHQRSGEKLRTSQKPHKPPFSRFLANQKFPPDLKPLQEKFFLLTRPRKPVQNKAPRPKPHQGKIPRKPANDCGRQAFQGCQQK